ncbi:hypothetical protein [Chitinimonas lacunae]|uniref:MSHA biogenesis protein MshK n=1 Tax=Chitinimonas lacunae TaxID=1963018 RepID=A0ABV8MU48_9NEIS
MAWRLIHLFALILGTLALAADGDPTKPVHRPVTPTEAGDTPREPVLQSILIGSQRRIAVIDGMARRVGDPVGDAEVSAIEADRVSLKGPGGVRQLRLLDPALRKTPPSAKKTPVQMPDKQRNRHDSG